MSLIINWLFWQFRKTGEEMMDEGARWKIEKARLCKLMGLPEKVCLGELIQAIEKLAEREAAWQARELRWQDLGCNVCQILDVVKGEWKEEWSTWDQSVRDGFSEMLRSGYELVDKSRSGQQLIPEVKK